MWNNARMVAKAKPKMGRPPLPADQRKIKTSVYLTKNAHQVLREHAKLVGQSDGQIISQVLVDSL